VSEGKGVAVVGGALLRVHAPPAMLDDRPTTWTRGTYRVTTDRALVSLDDALALLHDTHWGGTLAHDVLARAMRNSVCFALLDGERLVGFARAVTDLATYAYLTDVVVAASARGQGLGTWIVECILAHPDLQRVRRITLLTRDVPAFYARLGFTPGAGDRHYFERRP
jgi:N-acetylglutamate synthase-like GNAT family acetyltransferase